jgi:hypothetical protein
VTTLVQIIQLIVSLLSIVYVIRAYNAARKDQHSLSISVEATYDGSDIAAAGNVQREFLLMITHVILFVGVSVASVVIPYDWQEWRILVVRSAIMLATLVLLRVSATAWKRRLEIIERIRQRRQEGLR